MNHFVNLYDSILINLIKNHIILYSLVFAFQTIQKIYFNPIRSVLL